MIKAGDKLPSATFQKMGASGPEAVSVDALTKGRKVVLFGLPGAYTGTCSTLHLPSFMRTAEAFRAKGIDEIACISVNDVFVMKAWAESTGADKSGISMLSDGGSEFTKAIDLAFDAPPVGLYGRSKRYAMLVEDGVVKQFNLEVSPGVCEMSAGETLLEQI
jgi:glutaredoxin/glutathione-dependent peroxiredoxin